MTASREYQSEIEQLKAQVLQLEIEKGMLKSSTDQDIGQLKKHNALLHHFLMASAQTDPLVPDISPVRGFRGGRRMSGLGLAGSEVRRHLRRKGVTEGRSALVVILTPY